MLNKAPAVAGMKWGDKRVEISSVLDVAQSSKTHQRLGSIERTILCAAFFFFLNKVNLLYGVGYLTG